jgi:hypothetical protein
MQACMRAAVRVLPSTRILNSVAVEACTTETKTLRSSCTKCSDIAHVLQTE